MAEEYPIPRKLWEHPNPKSTEMWKFKTSLEKATGRSFKVGTTLNGQLLWRAFWQIRNYRVMSVSELTVSAEL